MAYYQGDYYQGDFFKRLGRGIRKVGRSIGRVAKTLAPLAPLVLPAVGTATLLGRGITTARQIKRAGRAARSIVPNPAPTQSPTAIVSQMTGSIVGTVAPEPLSVTAGTRKMTTIRRALKRRRATTRSRARANYRRRVMRRRSRR